MDDAVSFIAELESKRGGHIDWKSVALFYADSDLNKKDSVFLYKINDTFFYEDFEREFSFLGFKVKPPKDYDYVKFEGCFNINDVVDTEVVLKKDAILFCCNKITSVKKAGVLSKLFRHTVLKISLKNGKVLFMELLNPQEFIKFCKEIK